MLQNHHKIIIDVRSPEEFELDHYENSINIPLDKLEREISKFNDKQEIITICKSGVRSEFAKNMFVNLGFNATNGSHLIKLK